MVDLGGNWVAGLLILSFSLYFSPSAAPSCLFAELLQPLALSLLLCNGQLQALRQLHMEAVASLAVF